MGRIDSKIFLGRQKHISVTSFFLFCLKIDIFGKKSIFPEKSPESPRFLLKNYFQLCLKVCKWFGTFLRKNRFLSKKEKKRSPKCVFVFPKNVGVNATRILDRKTEFAYGALYTGFGIPLFNLEISCFKIYSLEYLCIKVNFFS